MTNEEIIKDYTRLKLEYTRLHEDYRRLQAEQLRLDDVSKSFYSDNAINRLKTEYFEKGLKAGRQN